jgi:hypothetical protein
MKCEALLLALFVLLGAALAQSGQVPTAQSPTGVSPPGPATTMRPFATPQTAIVLANATDTLPEEPNVKLIQQDPAYRAGYDDGYRQGANDSEANSTTYDDESGSVYEDATNGYNAQYGDPEKYRKLFRLGYIAGYKAGWDFNAGRYCGNCGPGGP